MTQDNILKKYIEDFDKVCRVSSIISQTCQIQNREWLEKELLNKWAKTVLNKQRYSESFILAKVAFITYLRSDENVANKDPITAFIIDTLYTI